MLAAYHPPTGLFGSVKHQNDNYLFIETVCEFSALLGFWHTYGTIKVLPKDECTEFQNEQECMDYLFKNTLGEPIDMGPVLFPDPEYTPETPLT